MKIKQIGEVKYNITPTLSESEEFNGYHFIVGNGSTSVSKIYEKTVILQQDRIKSKLVKREHPQTKINHDTQKISNNIFHQGSRNRSAEQQASVAKTLLLSVTTILLQNFVKY